MAIEHVNLEDQRLLNDVSRKLSTSKKIVVITGAGISTSCGIPDFRSQDGLYSLINAEHTARHSRSREGKAKGHIKGKDLFDANLWKHEESTSTFYTFIASLRRRIKNETRETSATHKFIKRLRNERKLVRCYTQNIDGLEAREDLCTDMGRGKGSRSRFTKASLALPTHENTNVPGGKLEGGCEVVQLHGDLESLRCTICRYEEPCDRAQEAQLLQGQAPPCPNCAQEDSDRRERGKRGCTIGTLRPNVVLYGEQNPASETISSIVTNDLRLGPDLLLIFGTSLKVHGLKSLVKEFARVVHSKKNGKVIFVNLSPPAESIWKETIDYWIDMDCDSWTSDKLRERQSRIPFKTKKDNYTVLGKISALEDKENFKKPSTLDEVIGEVTKKSPTKTVHHGLPSPPPSKRKALSDIAFGTANSESMANGRKAEYSIEVATPSKRRITSKSASEGDCVILSSPSRSQVGLVTPQSKANTPRKRRKMCSEFMIWDSEDGEANDDHGEMQDLPSAILETPSRRGRKRKLV